MLQAILKKINTRDKKDYPYLLILLIACILVGMLDAYVLYLDNTPFTFDSLDYFLLSKNVHQSLNELDLRAVLQYLTFGYGKDYPPFLLVMPILTYFSFGMTQDSASLSCFLFIPVIVFSLFFIGKKLFSREVGVIAAITCILFPGILSFSRVFLPDIPMTAMTTLAFLLYLYSENFSSRRYSVLTGAAVGIGMMFKYTFIIYFLPILLTYEGLFALRKRRIFKKNLINLFLFSTTALAIMLPWYFHNTNIIISEISLFNTETKNSFESKTYMLHLIPRLKIYTEMSTYIFGYFSIIICIASVYALLYRLSRADALHNQILPLLLSSSISSFLICVVHPSSRYLLPVAPSFALMCAYATYSASRSIVPTKKRSSFILPLIILAMLVISVLSYHRIYVKMENQDIYYKGLMFPASMENPAETIAESLSMGYNSSILVLQDSPIMYSAVQLLRSRHKVVFPTFCLSDKHTIASADCRIVFLRRDLCRFDFIIDSNELNSEKKDNKEIDLLRSVTSDSISACYPGYVLFKTFENIPLNYNSDSKILIYRNAALRS